MLLSEQANLFHKNEHSNDFENIFVD